MTKDSGDCGQRRILKISSRKTYPSIDPLLISPYGSASEYNKLVTLRSGVGCPNLPFRPLGVFVLPASGWALGIIITGVPNDVAVSSSPTTTFSPTLRSQTHIAPSRPPEYKISPCRLLSHAMDLTEPVWPRRWRSVSAPEGWMLEIWTELLAEAVARSLSSADHWTSKIPFA